MKKMLVVDNNPVMLKLMVNLLEKEGYDVRAAKDGLSALDIIKNWIPDVIFTDLVMPNISGEKLCQIIRSMPEMKGAYVVVLSAIAAEEEPDFDAFGVNACIAKGPFDQMKQHVLATLNQLNTGHASDLPRKIIGRKEIYARQITKELLSSIKHFEVILGNMDEGILELTPEAKTVYANSAAISLIGIPEEELLGSDFTEFFCEEDSKFIKKLMAEMSSTARAISEESPVLLNGKHVLVNILPVIEEDNRSMAIILNNITERKRMESQLQQARKMEAVATLSGGIAHDFNNILSIVMGNIDMAYMGGQPGDHICNFLDPAKNALLKARTLIQKFITFSTGGTLIKNVISAEELVKNSVRLAFTGKGVKIEYDLAEDLWNVEIDYSKMSQAVQNVIVNAKEAMPEGGAIKIAAKNIEIISEEKKGDLLIQEGRYVKISIIDNGHGIPAADMDKIFDPYFSTKERGSRKGMGMGLSLAYAIIRNHEGYIDIQSETESGTTVEIYLPVSDKVELNK